MLWRHKNFMQKKNKTGFFYLSISDWNKKNYLLKLWGFFNIRYILCAFTYTSIRKMRLLLRFICGRIGFIRKCWSKNKERINNKSETFTQYNKYNKLNNNNENIRNYSAGKALEEILGLFHYLAIKPIFLNILYL